MHIILDSNIYAADYRMGGVSFRTLFEYMRRTRSRLVLPHVIREEVVYCYARRLESESKAFEKAWNKYRLLDLGTDRGTFQEPDIRRKMTELRRKLMKPTDGIKPLYVREFKGAFLEEAFMRGVRRDRPASEQGEELRDVMLWLWALEYCDSAGSQVAFISADSGFWDKEGAHPQIDADLGTKEGRIGVYRSITDFLQRHAPSTTDATREWVEQHFQIQAIEGQLIDRALRDLSARLGGAVRDVEIERHELLSGRVYDVAEDTQFAELELKVAFRFTQTAFPISEENESLSPLGLLSGRLGFSGGRFGSRFASRFGSRYGSRFSGDRLGGSVVPVASLLSAPDPTTRAVRCDGFVSVSVRVKSGEPSETSLDSLTIDRAQLWKLAMMDETPGYA